MPGPRGERPAVTGAAAKAAAEYLASLTLGNPEAIEYDFKSLPRPKGHATRVIVTEYDLPRKEAMPHDVIVDADGKVWYIDFGHQFAGVMDAKTGQVKDIPIPVLKPEQPKGGLDLQFDPQGNLWLSLMYQAGIAKIDRKTHEVTMYPFPKGWQTPSTQASMVAPGNSDADGKVWTNNQEDHYGYRLDLATGRFEDMGPAKAADGKRIRAYGMPTDLQNNVYQLEFGNKHIGRRDGKTGAVVEYLLPKTTNIRRVFVDDTGSRPVFWVGSNLGASIVKVEPLD